MMKSLADVLGVEDITIKKEDRPPAVVDPAQFKLTVKAFCKEVLSSRQYREALLRRIVCDALPPAIEQLLYYYANGKPVEHVKIEDETTPLSELTLEQLEQRNTLLHQAIVRLRLNVDVPAEDTTHIH